MHLFACWCMHVQFVCLSQCTCICLCVHAFVCLFVHACIVCLFVCAYICLLVLCLHAFVYLFCVCMHLFVCLCMHKLMCFGCSSSSISIGQCFKFWPSTWLPRIAKVIQQSTVTLPHQEQGNLWRFMSDWKSNQSLRVHGLGDIQGSTTSN